MSYNYQTERPFVFTEEGQEMLLRVRDYAMKSIKKAGAVRMDMLMQAAGTGSSWSMMACVDRLVERKDLVEVSSANCMGQHRIFTNYDL